MPSNDINLSNLTMVVYSDGLEPVTLVGRLVIQGNFVHIYGNKPQKPEIPTAAADKPCGSGITSVLTESALVRLLYDGNIVTAGVTHVTCKAWRLFNTELGWAWIPKNVLRWSPQIGMFCIVDPSYFPTFHTEDSFCDEAPVFIENPQKLIDLLYEEQSTETHNLL